MKICNESFRSNEKSVEENPLASYSNYVALDWSMDNVCIATMKAASKYPQVVQLEANVELIKEYAQHLAGKSILCFEETTGSHWLYVELKEYFDEIIVCDPYRNALLKEGAKTDKIDAAKLCQLLRSGLIKGVYHSLDSAYEYRQLANSYLQLQKLGTRLKNQKSALYRAKGKRYKKESLHAESDIEDLIYHCKDSLIEAFEREKAAYKKFISNLVRQNRTMRALRDISGIGDIFAFLIFAIVIDATRFPDKYHYWSYCGLVMHQKQSGGRDYGQRRGRYHRVLKWVYNTAALAAITNQNDIRHYYDYLLQSGYSTRNAKHAISRYIAKVTWAMIKNQTRYEPYRWRKNMEEK